MAIQTEVWESDIKEVLFAGFNDFLRMSVNHDAFVEDKTVHVPQAGSMPAVAKNRSVVPATISERTDTDLSYDLDEYTTDPILLKNIDRIQVSYDRRASYLNHHMNLLKDRMAAEGIYQWASDTASQQVRTSGAAGTDALPPSGTGNRLALVTKDINNLAKIMDEQNVPDDGRRMLMLPAAMYHQIFDVNDLIRNDIIQERTLAKGAITKILGFNILKRSSTLVYDNAATPARKAVGAAGAATDNFGAIAWHPDFVASALGTIKVFDDSNKPEYYGDVMSALVMARSAKLRADQVGIATLVQGQ